MCSVPACTRSTSRGMSPQGRGPAASHRGRRTPVHTCLHLGRPRAAQGSHPRFPPGAPARRSLPGARAGPPPGRCGPRSLHSRKGILWCRTRRWVRVSQGPASAATRAAVGCPQTACDLVGRPQRELPLSARVAWCCVEAPPNLRALCRCRGPTGPRGPAGGAPHSTCPPGRQQRVQRQRTRGLPQGHVGRPKRRANKL